MKKLSEGLGSLFHLSDICHFQNGIIFFLEVFTFDNLRITHDDATGIEIIIKSLALAKELRGEEEIELLHSFCCILDVEVSSVTNRDGTLDDHHCIGVHL